MSVEFLDDLEKKVALLIQHYQKICQENAEFKRETGKKTSGASEIEKENRALKKEIGVCKNDLLKLQEKLSAARERIQSLIARIEAA